jgi:hypothetical protein
MGYAVFGCRSLIGLVFLVAVVTKVRDFDGFAGSVRRLAPLLGRLTVVAAGAVLGAELLVVALLAVPGTLGWGTGLALALVLDLAFTVAMVLALRRGVTAPCHCFGSPRRPLGAVDVARDVVLAAAAAVGLVGAAPGTPPHPLGLLVAGAAGAFLAPLLILLDDLVELFVPGPAAWDSTTRETSPWHTSVPR